MCQLHTDSVTILASARSECYLIERFSNPCEMLVLLGIGPRELHCGIKREARRVCILPRQPTARDLGRSQTG